MIQVVSNSVPNVTYLFLETHDCGSARYLHFNRLCVRCQILFCKINFNLISLDTEMGDYATLLMAGEKLGNACSENLGFGPPRDKTKWHVRPAKTQISLGIRPV